MLAGQFDGTEGNVRPSNAPHGVRQVHAPHTWGTCQADVPLTNSLGYPAGQSTGHQVGNWKTGPAWISYSRRGAFYTKFSITTPEFLVFLSQPAFLVAHFLLSCPYTTIISVIVCILPVYT